MPRPPTPFDDLPRERDLGGLSGRSVGRRTGAGPRAVILHGGPGLDHHLLVPFALELRGLEVLIPDLPGHGGSRVPHRPPPDLVGVVEETAAFMSRLEPAPDVLIGHSLGAHLALRLVADGAIRPRALVLLAPPGPHPHGGGDRLREAQEDPRRLRRALLSILREQSAAPLEAVTVEAVERCRLQSPMAHASLLGQLRRQLDRETPRPRHLPRTLVLTGDRDGIAPPEAAEQLAMSLGRCDLEVLSGRGHWAVVTEPAEVARVVLEFIEGRGLGGSPASRA